MRTVLLLGAVVSATALASCGGDSTAIHATTTVNRIPEAYAATFIVPRVVGKKEDQAKFRLRDGGFPSVEVRSVPNSAPAGTVLDQDPRGGSSVTPGATVTLTVSTGKP